MTELTATGTAGLTTALRALEQDANPATAANGETYQGRHLGVTTNFYPEECTTFLEVAQYMLDTVFDGHTLNHIWIISFDGTHRRVSYSAVVDRKDWSLRRYNGWNTVAPFKTEEELIVSRINAAPTVREFVNESENEFTDISSEATRTYNFGQKGFVKINRPLKLSVSSSGGHRLYTADGQSHYVPAGWIQLSWTVREGEPNFVK